MKPTNQPVKYSYELVVQSHPATTSYAQLCNCWTRTHVALKFRCFKKIQLPNSTPTKKRCAKTGGCLCFQQTPMPLGSVGLAYLPTFTIKFKPNVGKHTIHGSYGMKHILRLSFWFVEVWFDFVHHFLLKGARPHPHQIPHINEGFLAHTAKFKMSWWKADSYADFA